MTISMYTASVPVFQHMLRNLSHILDKGEAHAAARKIDPAVLLQSRLYPDMLPLTRQVLIACDAAKNGVARISGVEAPKFEDNEASFPELKARIQKTIDYLQSVPAIFHHVRIDEARNNAFAGKSLQQSLRQQPRRFASRTLSFGHLLRPMLAGLELPFRSLAEIC